MPDFALAVVVYGGLALIGWLYYRELDQKAASVTWPEVQDAINLLKRHGGRIDFTENDPPFPYHVARAAENRGLLIHRILGGPHSTDECYELTDEARTALRLHPARRGLLSWLVPRDDA